MVVVPLSARAFRYGAGGKGHFADCLQRIEIFSYSRNETLALLLLALSM
jgi:hypothetical protein